MSDSAIVPCPNCGGKCSVDPGHLTRRLRCPHCQDEFVPAGGGGGGGGGRGRDDRDRDRDRRPAAGRRGGGNNTTALLGVAGIVVAIGLVGFVAMKAKAKPKETGSGRGGTSGAVAVEAPKALAPDPRGPAPVMLEDTISLSPAPSGTYALCSTLRDTQISIRLWKDPHELWRPPAGGKAKKAGNIEHDGKVEALGQGTNKYGTPVYKVRGRTKHNSEIIGFVSAFYVEHNNKIVANDEKHVDGDEWERRGIAKD